MGAGLALLGPGAWSIDAPFRLKRLESRPGEAGPATRRPAPPLTGISLARGTVEREKRNPGYDISRDAIQGY